MRIKIDEISEIVAKELNANELTIKEINRSQWKLLHKIMQETGSEPVKVIYLGKFSKRLKSNSNAIRRNIQRIQAPDL